MMYALWVSILVNIIVIFVLLKKQYNFTVTIPDPYNTINQTNNILEEMLALAKKRDRDGIRLWGYTFESFKQCDANFKELTKRIEALEK